MEWKQAYDTGELENTAHIPGTVTDLAALPVMYWFYSKKEAESAAALIGWPKNSAARVSLPLGRSRWGIADPHRNFLTSAGYSRLRSQRRQ